MKVTIIDYDEDSHCLVCLDKNLVEIYVEPPASMYDPLSFVGTKFKLKHKKCYSQINMFSPTDEQFYPTQSKKYLFIADELQHLERNR